jgi:hypothetical protein
MQTSSGSKRDLRANLLAGFFLGACNKSRGGVGPHKQLKKRRGRALRLYVISAPIHNFADLVQAHASLTLLPYSPLLFSLAMCVPVASSAKGDEILLRIIATAATELFVVNLKIGRCAARLASPAISPQDFLPKPFVVFRVEP